MLVGRWSAIVLLTALLLWFGHSVGNPAENKSAKPAPAPPQEQCMTLPAKQAADSAGAASIPTEPTKILRVLAGGAIARVEIPVVAPANSVYCARFLEEGRSPRVLAAIPGTGEKTGTTAVTLEVPELGFWYRQREFVLVSFPVESKGQLKLDSPGVAVRQKVWVSNGLLSFAGALAAVLLAYLVAVAVLGRIGKSYSFNPVYLTSGTFDKASLSQFQIFGFTLLVLGLLVFAMLRTNVLSDISTDILLLLGISAGGAGGSKVAGIMKKRLAFDNWSWLRNQGWLTGYEAGLGQAPDPHRARWGDLLKAEDGSLDVYSFQLVTFSLLVAYSLLTSDLEKLATFSVPPNLLALLGLSNVVYIGGKAVAPNSVGELDEKVRALRDAEKNWVAKVVAVVSPLPDQPSKQGRAKTDAPAEYQGYITAAREAARMLKAVYGADGTKFEVEPISDADLMPAFP